MISSEEQVHVPKFDVKIEEKLLKPEVVVEVENQCDVEVDTTSV